MKIKTAQLVGAALDWAVAKCEGFKYELYEHNRKKWENGPYRPRHWQPSTDWAQGGPLLQAEMVEHGMSLAGIDYERGKFAAYYWSDDFGELEGAGPTPLIAAMRALVWRKLGDEVDVPDEFGAGTP